MKVFKLNDYEYWMAPTIEEAIEDWKIETGCADEELEDPRELTDKEMDSFRVAAGEDCEKLDYLPCSFKKVLERMVADGAKTGFFACDEY